MTDHKPFECTGSISGSCLTKVKPHGNEVKFEFTVRPLPWVNTDEPAECQVTILIDGDTNIDRPIYGIDPLQAVDLGARLVNQLRIGMMMEDG